MIDERPSGHRESPEPNAEPPDSVGPLHPAGEPTEDAPLPSPAPPGDEYVGRAQPIGPERRRGRSQAARDADPTQREAAQPDPPDPEPLRRAPVRAQDARPQGARRARVPSARGAVDRVRAADFPVVLRGYDRAAVDAYVAEIAQLVAELEATQLPETVVQRALDEVGVETSAILKRAHEAGEEITTRSRSQAEDRLRRADREAELTRKEAEDQVRRLEDDIQSIWQERQRLIEDVRTLADDVLALADDAMERLPAPRPGAAEAENLEETSEELGAEEARASETGHASTADYDGPAVDGEPRPDEEDTAERPSGL